MNVRELIAKLELLDPNLDVIYDQGERTLGVHSLAVMEVFTDPLDRKEIEGPYVVLSEWPVPIDRVAEMRARKGRTS